MKQCIFCRKEKADCEFNKEHIILDSLGGRGSEDICYDICKSCNSSLGTRVDACLTNHETTKFLRYLLKIKGRNGVPNPFRGVKIAYADTPFIGELKTDKNGNISGFRADNKVYQMDGKTIIVGSRKGFARYVQSQLKQNGFPSLSEENIEDRKIAFGEPKIPFVKELEFLDEGMENYVYFAFPAMLKMAYEFCFIKLGQQYLNDLLAFEIRDFLLNFDYRQLDSYICPTNASVEWTNTRKPEISIRLFVQNTKLYVTVDLYGFVICTICMSEAVSNYKRIDESELKIEV